MVLENGSAYHLTRDTRSSGSLPSPRASAHPTVPSTHPARRITGPRRKRSAEHAVLTQRTNALDQPDQENKFIIHRCTSSLETIRTRSSKPKKSPQVADHDTALLSVTSAGALKHKLKSFFPSSIIVFDLRGESKNFGHDPRRPRVQKQVKQPDVVAPSSQPSPASLDVDHPDVATGTATLTTTYLSIDALDDLFRWDMDYIPTIPSTHSPPDNLTNTTRSPNRSQPPSTTSPTPFSTPIDDDELLEYEIPFPLNRQTKVVLENMGVKKSKTIARTRSASGVSAVNRQFLSPKAESVLPENADDLTENRSLGLPNPLPPRTMCPKRDALYPLGCASSSLNIQPTSVPSPSRKVSPNPSSSRQDAWGCTHLGAADCELSVLFPQTSHFEVWDMGDNAHIACPAMLCILAKDPRKWAGKPLALPDVSLINIRCKDIPFPSPMSKYDRSEEYTTLYTGPKTGTANDDLIPDKYGATPFTGPSGISSKAISLDGKWARTYKKPGVEGNSRRMTRVFGQAHMDVEGGGDTSSPATGPGAVRGWYLQFWIPIPTRLFEKRETRAFAINARVWMMGDEQRVLSLDKNEDGKVFPLLAYANMTVSHLRKERDMDGCW